MTPARNFEHKRSLEEYNSKEKRKEAFTKIMAELWNTKDSEGRSIQLNGLHELYAIYLKAEDNV